MPCMVNSVYGVGSDRRHAAGFPAVKSRASFESEQLHLFSFAERPSLSDLEEAAQGGSAKAAGRDGGLQLCSGHNASPFLQAIIYTIFADCLGSEPQGEWCLDR